MLVSILVLMLVIVLMLVLMFMLILLQQLLRNINFKMLFFPAFMVMMMSTASVSQRIHDHHESKTDSNTNTYQTIGRKLSFWSFHSFHIAQSIID